MIFPHLFLLVYKDTLSSGFIVNIVHWFGFISLLFFFYLESLRD